LGSFDGADRFRPPPASATFPSLGGADPLTLWCGRAKPDRLAPVLHRRQSLWRKATAYLHKAGIRGGALILKGGILRYLEECPRARAAGGGRVFRLLTKRVALNSRGFELRHLQPFCQPAGLPLIAGPIASSLQLRWKG